MGWYLFGGGTLAHTDRAGRAEGPLAGFGHVFGASGGAVDGDGARDPRPGGRTQGCSFALADPASLSVADPELVRFGADT